MSSGFLTESEIEETRKKRQEEWERVRKPDDPLEAPELPYDSRSLYDRLQEQKQKKDLEYEESHKLKNMIKGLDDDEVDFLELVDRTKLAADRKQTLEEEIELNDYRNRVATLQKQSQDLKLQSELLVNKPKPLASNRPSQTKLLKGVIINKSETKKRKVSECQDKMEEVDNNKKVKTEDVSNSKDEKKNSGDVKNSNNKNPPEKQQSHDNLNVNNTPSALVCVGILPGLGNYQESSSEECSSDSEPDVPLDLLGRKIVKKDKETKNLSIERSKSSFYSRNIRNLSNSCDYDIIYD